MKVTWQNDNGDTIVMGDDQAVIITRGVGGFAAPPMAVSKLERGQAAGAFVTGHRWQMRTLVLPVWVNPGAYTQLLRAIAVPNGTLTVESNVRTGKATAVYQGGVETFRARPGGYKGVLRFALPWPFFLSATEWYKKMTAEGKPLAYPFGYPFRVLGGDTLADTTITNNGEVDAWPRWKLTGAASRWELRNISTGKTLIVSYALGVSETMTITTRPGEGAVLDAGGASLLDYVSGELWPLAPGDNNVTVVAVDATAETQAEMWYNDEYMGV